jgi:hypothetical protein
MEQNCTGHQEYESRQAGITFGIILAVMVPLVLVILFVVFKMLRKRREREIVAQSDQGGYR